MWEKRNSSPRKSCMRPKRHDFSREAGVFKGIPSVERTAKGRLFACFYGGELEEQQGNYAVLAISDDVGRTWTEPYLVVSHPDERMRVFDPCLWMDPLAGFGLPGASRSVILTACMACGPAYATRRTRRSPFLARRAELPTA